MLSLLLCLVVVLGHRPAEVEHDSGLDGSVPADAVRRRVQSSAPDYDNSNWEVIKSRVSFQSPTCDAGQASENCDKLDGNVAMKKLIAARYSSNFWISQSGMPVECATTETCASSGPNGNTCRGGSVGLLCNQCFAGYSSRRLGEPCQKCPVKREIYIGYFYSRRVTSK